jgi:hypothetical protein
MTPLSSANQQSTAISQLMARAGPSSGTCRHARASKLVRSQAGQPAASPASTRPVSSSAAGIASTNGLPPSEFRFELILRRRMGPAWPCSAWPAKAPISECPVAGSR